MTRTLPVPVEQLPIPRVICWHGEHGEDPQTDRMLAVVQRTYQAALNHGLVDRGVRAGGNDWTGWHLPDRGLVDGLVQFIEQIAPSHWTITR